MRTRLNVALFRSAVAFSLLFLAACSASQQPASPAVSFTAAPVDAATEALTQYVQAIREIRPILGLPDLPLGYVDQVGMVNSPDANWEVAEYKDSQGRKYSVETETNRVVEIDGRNLLSHGTPVAGALPVEELRTRAGKIAQQVVADFSSLQSKLTYEEGNKGDNYFFTWRDDYSPASFNRPFLQLAFLKDGRLFAYYNTLSSK